MNSLREQLIRDEGGYQRFMYFDSVKVPTIGVGRNLKHKGLSKAEQDFMLDNDIAEYDRAVDLALPWARQLDAIRREVLVNMAFNLGIAGLIGFSRFLTALQARDYELASHEMLDSKWAVQTGLRASRLARQIRTGERQ